jgi:hypothetical protein
MAGGVGTTEFRSKRVRDDGLRGTILGPQLDRDAEVLPRP